MQLKKLSRMASQVALLVSTPFVVSCAVQDIDELHNMPHKGSEFAQDLANQYEMLAKRNHRKSSSENASFFAIKGRHAAAGMDVAPENPEKWDNVSEHMMTKLMQSRLHLVTLLDRGGRSKLPQEAAAAQAGFDCMVSEQTPCGCSSDDTAMCRALFSDNIKKLEDMMPAHVIHFEKNESKLTPDAVNMLNQIANIARATPGAKVHIIGFTDPEGDWKNNLVLSQNRAYMVAQGLVKMGIDESRLHAVGKGEISGPKVMPEHRKVVVYIH